MSKTKKTRQRRLTQMAQRRTNQALSRKANAGQRLAQSQQAEHAVSQLHGLLEGETRQYAIGLLEKFDGMSGLRNATRKIAEMRGEWAGLPMMLDGHELTVEPTHPYAERLMQAGAKVAARAVIAEEDELSGVLPVPSSKLRNVFWSWRYRAPVAIMEDVDGKIVWGPLGTSNQIGMQLETLGASDAWGIEQESNAVNLLGTFVRHRQFKQYLMTGMFLEKSKRSGVHYLFRRLRPTVAMVESRDGGEMRMLCALCLHPIAYYSESHAGAMCPTDEIIAHLMLMRGDEHLYWRRANQHAPYRKEAAV